MTESSAPAARSRWRLTYVPGDWLALAGPNAAVVLQPASPQWSELVATIWQDVLAATSIDDLLERMASFRLEGMPNFAAFFWAEGALHSLVRGGVQLLDPADGTVIADGARIRTWTESALDGIERIEVRVAPPSDQRRLELPLVVGVAGISSVIVDVRPERQVELGGVVDGSAAAAPGDDAAGGAAESSDPVEIVPVADPADGTAAVSGDVDGPATELLIDPFAEAAASAEPEAPAGTAPEAAPEAADPAQDDVDESEDDFDESEDGRTLLAPSLPGAPQMRSTAPASRVVVAFLTPSSGGRVGVDRPILVGRSPSASRVAGDQLPRLLTVPSPSHDISRTHLQVLPGDDSVVLTDMNSTNGTVLITPDGRQLTLEPSTPVAVDFGSVIDLGDGVTIRVDAPDGV